MCKFFVEKVVKKPLRFGITSDSTIFDFKGDDMSESVSVSEAARIKKVTRQAIYLAIKEKKLRAYRDGDSWRILLGDLYEYDKQRYSRENSVFNGELIFDESKGYVSFKKASEITKIPKQKLYYAARTGKLKFMKKNKSWVVKIDDLLVYQSYYSSKYFTKKRLCYREKVDI